LTDAVLRYLLTVVDARGAVADAPVATAVDAAEGEDEGDEDEE
jgi:hypothetical protein